MYQVEGVVCGCLLEVLLEGVAVVEYIYVWTGRKDWQCANREAEWSRRVVGARLIESIDQ